MTELSSPDAPRRRPIRHRMMLLLTIALLLAAAAVVFGVWRYQSFGVYRFDTTVAEPPEVGLPDARVVRFRSEDGAEISAWLQAPAPGKVTLLSFFGGFTSVGPSARRMLPLLGNGYGLAMLVYRGSSGDRGEPSERAFAMDARALYDQLDGLLGVSIPVEQRVLHGVSLGSSVAAGLAAERPAAGLILEASFDRCCRWHSRRMFHLPMCLLMWRERHDVVDKLAGVTTPKLQLHGERDDAVPIAWARALFDALVGQKRFVSYAGGGHADLFEHGAVADITAFVDSL